MASCPTPAASRATATANPVRSLPAKQCTSTGRPSPSRVITSRTARPAPASVGNRSYSAVIHVSAASAGSSAGSVIIFCQLASCGAAAT